MTIFADKLDGLGATAALVRAADLTSLRAAMTDGLRRPAICVGSGGSLASVHYFSHCRETLGAGPTVCQTPLEFVVGNFDLGDIPVWFFTSRGENPDIRAAIDAADQRGAREIHVVTSNPDLFLSRSGQGSIATHVLPVADPKDGFLSTHSLVAAVYGLLLASQSTGILEQDGLLDLFSIEMGRRLSTSYRSEVQDRVARTGAVETLIVLADPRLSAAGVVLETSLWETAILPVQRTDFRNFAHGRHTWLAHRVEQTLVLALTGHLTTSVWEDLRAALPQDLKAVQLDFGNAGRLGAALAIIEALVWVEALGVRTDIDPGKPNPGSFAKTVYEAESLIEINRRLTSPARLKWEASSRRDLPSDRNVDAIETHAKALSNIATARFGAVVLDYDGTVVATEHRFDPPAAEVRNEIARLLEQGMMFAFATGRGGSGGHALRALVPADFHPRVTVGYYNGGWICPLAENIEVHIPPNDPVLLPVAAWLELQSRLFREATVRPPGRQVTIAIDNLLDREEFFQALDQAPFMKAGDVTVVRSQHSIDIVPASSSKINVVRQVQAALPAHLSVLCIGDSGGESENDFELLGHPYGVSVGNVCHRNSGCWPLFGVERSGPAALITILSSLHPAPTGGFAMKLESLTDA